MRAIVLTGAGRAFCSGGDVEDIIGALFERDAEGLLEFTRITGDLIRQHAPLPHADRRRAQRHGGRRRRGDRGGVRHPHRAPSAKIAFLFTKVGLSGADMGASWLLPRLVGMAARPSC